LKKIFSGNRMQFDLPEVVEEDEVVVEAEPEEKA
jgi:hypothetical protein